MSEESRSPAAHFTYLDSIQQSRKKYAALLEPVCRRYGLTRNELDILLFLANNPCFDRAADIVAIRRIAKSHVSLSVGNLENRGLLRRETGPEDRRAVHLRLTESAGPMVRAGQQIQKRFHTQMFHGLSRQELAQWGRILDRICSNIEAIDTNSSINEGSEE